METNGLSQDTASAATQIVVPKVKVFAPPQPEVVKLEPPKIVMPKVQTPRRRFPNR